MTTTKFVKKMGTVLLGIQRDSISMDELHGKLASHPNVRDAIVQFSIGCGATNTRTEYEMSERYP